MNVKAQVTLEVAILIIIVTAAFVAMAGYLRRTIQADWRTKADSFSEGQYDPKRSTVLPSSGTLIIETENVGVDFLYQNMDKISSGRVSQYADPDTGGTFINIENWRGQPEGTPAPAGSGSGGPASPTKTRR